MQKLPRLGRRQVGAGRFKSGWKPAAVARAPANAATAQQGGLMVVEEARKQSSVVSWVARRVGGAFLFGGFASPFPTREGCSPAPPRHCARIVPVFVPTKPLARRRGVWGCVRVLQRLYNHHPRAQERVREKSQLGG